MKKIPLSYPGKVSIIFPHIKGALVSLKDMSTPLLRGI